MSADELKLLKQWVCAKEDKIPVDIFGRPASVTDPRTWNTHADCVKAGFPYIGFVLTTDDPYTFIDLDEPVDKDGNYLPETAERQTLIYEKFDSYAEVSASGKGLHIIVKGQVPKGVRRDKVEVYSDNRYMICTFKAFNDKAIENRQELLDIMFEEMNSTMVGDLEQVDSMIPDAFLLEMAAEAANGEKFVKLCQGEWEADYPSQSEADLALLSIIAYYTRDNTQVRRLFRATRLGKREKAQRDNRYIDYALKKIRAKQPTPVDVEHIKQAQEASPPPPSDESPPQPTKGLELPPGLVGEVAKYITASSTRPVPEVGLTAALALCAGFWGRAYNTSATGLNIYQILLAGTGTGKEGAQSGIERVVYSMRKMMPSIERCIGPAGFASGQALMRALDKQASFVSIIGEFGIVLSQICDSRANSAQMMLKRAFLDLYTKSGARGVVRSNVYADADKNTKMVISPSISILGESTPESFYGGITKDHIADGLIPRFSITHYSGPRPERNKNCFYDPPDRILKPLIEKCSVAFQLEQSHSVINVAYSAEGEQLIDSYDKFCDRKINETDQDVDAQLWNRAHLKAMKIAALIAVGVNHTEPTVTKAEAEWAIKFVTKDVTGVIEKFQTGKHGTGNARQEADLRSAFDAYLKMSMSKRRDYKVPKLLMAQGHIVPFAFLRRRLRLLRSFKDDRRGEVPALKALVKELCETDVLVKIPPEQAYAEYKTRSELYVRGPAW